MSIDTTGVSLGTVLVVGGTGFVGRHCIRDVLAKGASAVHTLNTHIPAGEQRIARVGYHASDLGDMAGVERVMQQVQPTVVIHVASPRPFVEQPAVYERVNVKGIRNMLAACDEVGTVRAFVYCSSASVIHDGDADLVNADESWPVLYAPEQREPYWASKAEGERLVLAHNRRAGTERAMLTTALRVTSIFGEDDQQIIGNFVARARTGELKTQIGDGKNFNDWTYVGTVAEAHTHAAKRLLRAVDTPDPPDRRVEGEAFFVTNDDPRPFWGFVRQVAAEAGYPVDAGEVRQLPAFMAFVIGYVAEWAVYIGSFGQRKSATCRRSMRFSVIQQIFCMDKAKRQLEFTPTIGIDEGIKRAVRPLLAQKRSDGTEAK